MDSFLFGVRLFFRIKNYLVKIKILTTLQIILTYGKSPQGGSWFYFRYSTY
jgi:hypothetical protein